MTCKFDRNEFRIVELDVLRGIPGTTLITTIPAKTKEEAIGKYYDINPGASKRILVVPNECSSIHAKGVKPRAIKKK